MAKRVKILFSSILASLALAGCSNLGETSPVLNIQGNQNQVSRPADPANPAPKPQNDNMAAKREIASFRADLDALAEQQKALVAKILDLEENLSKKDQQIKELQSLLDAMDKRFADVDSSWRNRMQELSSNIDREREARKREQHQFKQAVTKVITNQISGREEGSNYIVITVEKGDTLSKIAQAAKVKVEDIKKLNNLKSDIIQANQKLKIPQK